MNIKMIGLLLFGLMMVNAAEADWGKPHKKQRYHRYLVFKEDIEAQQQMQRRRIQRGLASGYLSRSEMKRLRRQQRKIEDLICRYDRDRHFSRHERRKIQKLLDKADYRIREFKHNDTYARRSPGNRHRKWERSYEYADNRDNRWGYEREINPISGKVIINW